ncbi:MAG: hypothetical protein PF630_00105 [Gammaproteobacteria bacterium]|jgi:hypothetical protein|nr:hypothetical protein [Gammaproteobacteria bacterium]
MNKKTLTTAVLAGLTGIAGIVSVSNAVHINPDGTGQVLIYPYYTTRDDNVTLISVVNTTSNVKAIKVRFIEGENSQEVLDFNLYMSPFDVWTATIADNSATGNPGFSTNDNTCLVPNISSNPFLTTLFAGDDRTGVDRAREGYVELIEMGDVVGALAANAIHGGTGVPASCAALSSAWVGGGVWAANPQAQMAPPSGGLFGGAVVINVPGARAVGYDATALDAFFVPEGGNIPSISLHSNPGDLNPSLAQAFPTDSNTYLATGPVVTPTVVTGNWGSGAEAVSASLMTDQVMNQYASEAGIGGNTEWVITFPTKRFHVNGAAAPVPPFNSVWDGGEACEEVALRFWDREEQTAAPGGPVISPPPEVPGLNLCWEVNVVTFTNSVPSDGPNGPVISDVLGSNLFVNFDLASNPGFESGWAQLGFNGSGPNGPFTHDAVSDNGLLYVGLPVTGFAVQTANNAGINALFGAAFEHAYARVIQAAPTAP